MFFDQATGRPVPNQNFLTVVEAALPKEATVVGGCQAGGRSQRAAEIMEQAGYSSVSNMMGGFGGGVDLETEDPLITFSSGCAMVFDFSLS